MTAKKLVFYNPHADDLLGILPYFSLRRRVSSQKYAFIVQQEILNNGAVQIIWDGTVSRFLPTNIFKRLPKLVRVAISHLELLLWLRVNDLNHYYVNYRRSTCQSSDAVLIMFAWNLADSEELFAERRETLKNFKNIVVHLSHYFQNTREKSKNLSTLESVWLAGDSDITTNEYFRVHFSWYKRTFLVLPFAVKDRYENKTPLSERVKKCVATGTLHDITLEPNKNRYKDFCNFFKSRTFHPVRKLIYDNESKIFDQIDVHISMFRGTKNPRIFGIFNILLVSQKDYFNLDIVSLYNGYVFAIVGEEATGFPAIGALEAMACGCIVLANPACYKGLGLKDGIHYISHDGTIDGILEKIRIMQTNSALLEGIVNAGVAIVSERFRPASAHRTWVQVLEMI